MLLRPSYLALAITVMLAGCADSVAPPTAASASSRLAPGTADQAKGASISDNYTFPVTFAIPVPWDPTNSCGLDTPVNGEGVFHVVAHASQKPDGSWNVNINWSAHGTAVGDDGTQYRFNYALASHAIDLTGPNYGLPGNFEVVDHFNLVGAGNAPRLKVAFRALINIDGADPTQLALTFTPRDFSRLVGEYNCDPI